MRICLSVLMPSELIIDKGCRLCNCLFDWIFKYKNKLKWKKKRVRLRWTSFVCWTSLNCWRSHAWWLYFTAHCSYVTIFNNISLTGSSNWKLHVCHSISWTVMQGTSYIALKIVQSYQCRLWNWQDCQGEFVNVWQQPVQSLFAVPDSKTDTVWPTKTLVPNLGFKTPKR